MDLITNSGEEIALWSEGAGKKAADIWRNQRELELAENNEALAEDLEAPQVEDEL